MAKLLLSLSFITVWLLDVYGVYKTFMNDSAFVYFWGVLVFILPVIFYKMWNTDINYVLSPSERWKEDEYFKQRITDLEDKYKNKTSSLRNKTVLLALFGYLTIFIVILGVLLAGIVLAITVNNIFGIGYYSILIALPFLLFATRLFLPFVSPVGGDRGVKLRPKDAPRVFGLLRKIEKRAKGKRFERVFIDMEMNASVSRSSGLFGLFGFGPVTLNLGLPLMQALSVNQLAGVIAHEYGHVAGNHNALAHWVYRIRRNWIDIGTCMHTEELWHILQLSKIYSLFIKHFKAYSFVLSRQCEYEADEVASRIAGAKNITSALIAMEFKAQHLFNDFWENIWKLSEDNPEPCGNPFSKMTEFFYDCDADDDIKTIENSTVDFDTTHPALPDRIDALGAKLQKNEPIKETSARKLLGFIFEASLASVFDDAWGKLNTLKWMSKHRKYQSAIRFIKKTNECKIGHLSTPELIQLINAAQIVEDKKRMIDVCSELLEREPDNGAAKINLLGLGLLHENKDINLVKLDEEVSVYPEHVATASSFAIRYLNKHHRYIEAKVYQYKLDDWNYKHQAAEDERGNIFSDDVFAYHSMSDEYVRKVENILSHHKVVKKAWLVRKEVHYFKDIRPLFVVFLGYGLFTFIDKQAVMTEIEKEFRVEGLSSFFEVFWVNDFKGLKSKVKKVQGSLVYRK